MSEQPRFKDFLFERADEAKAKGRLHEQIEYLVEHSEAVTEYLDTYGAPSQQKDAVGYLEDGWARLAIDSIKALNRLAGPDPLIDELEDRWSKLEAKEAGR